MNMIRPATPEEPRAVLGQVYALLRSLEGRLPAACHEWHEEAQFAVTAMEQHLAQAPLVEPPPTDAQCVQLVGPEHWHASDRYPALGVLQRVWRADGDLSVWRAALMLPLTKVPNIRSTAYLAAEWVTDVPQGSGPSANVPLAPPLRIARCGNNGVERTHAPSSPTGSS